MPTKNENNQALYIPTLAANTGAKTELFSAAWVVIAVGKETLVVALLEIELERRLLLWRRRKRYSQD
jgi:hypothetical protein